MKTLHHYKVFIPQVSYNYRGKHVKAEFKKSEINILAENEKFCVLEDSWFTKITKQKNWEFAYARLNKHKIRIRKCDVLGSGIIYELYSQKKKRSSTIRKHLKEYIDKQYQIYLAVSDLSFIK